MHVTDPINLIMGCGLLIVVFLYGFIFWFIRRHTLPEDQEKESLDRIKDRLNKKIEDERKDKK